MLCIILGGNFPHTEKLYRSGLRTWAAWSKPGSAAYQLCDTAFCSQTNTARHILFTCHLAQVQESLWDKFLAEKLLGQTVVPL